MEQISEGKCTLVADSFTDHTKGQTYVYRELLSAKGHIQYKVYDNTDFSTLAPEGFNRLFKKK